MITLDEVEVADRYLQMFCQEFERLYGAERCTPNMHLHLHLKECILDFGPVYAFWCFAFERFNGMLGAFPTNSKHIEPQLMKKILIQQQVFSHSLPSQFSSFSASTSAPFTGSVLQTVSIIPSDTLQLRAMAKCTIGSCDFKVLSTQGIQTIPPLKEYVLDVSAVSDIKWMYEQLYPNESIQHVNQICQSCPKVSVCGEVLSSRNTKNSCVTAHWMSTSLQNSASTTLRFGHIQYVLKHSIQTSAGQQEHILAVVNWLKPHPDEMYFGSTSFVLCSDHEGLNKYSYIPVQRIASRCCFANMNIELSAGFEDVIVVIPIPFKFSL